MTIHPREGGRKRPFTQPLSRRDFLRRSATTAAAVPFAAAFLAACGKPPVTGGGNTEQLNHPARPDNPVTFNVDQSMMIDDALKPEAGPLRLYNWVDYINPQVPKAFSKKYGVDVEVSTFSTMNEAVSKLANAKQNFDVFWPTPNEIGRLQDAGFLRPLNHSYLPNLTNVWDSFTGKGNPFYDVGQLYTVPYVAYTTGIGYRVDQGPNDHITLDLSGLEQSIPAMDNPYDIFWDTTYKGYVHILDDDREAIAMAFLRRGHTDINADNPATRTEYLNQAREDLIALSNTMHVKADISDYTDMPAGESYIHQSWSGDLIGAQYYYPGWSPRNIIRYWYPPDNKGVTNTDTMTVLAGGDNPVLAHTFLNFMLDYEMSLFNFSWLGYTPPQNQLTDPTQLVKGSPTQTDITRKYAVVPPDMANALVSQADVEKGYKLLQLAPDVESQFHTVWESFQTA